MLIYLASFILTIFIANLAKNLEGKLSLFLFFLSVLPVVLVAGFRDISIGGDLTAYVYDVFMNCMTGNDEQIYYINSSMEEGYILFNRIILLFTTDFNVFLFFLQYLILIPISLVLYRYREQTTCIFIIFLYLFLFYNESLNIVRQSIAISLILLAVVKLIDGSWLKFVLLSILAVTFHTSAILSLVLLPLYYISPYISGRLITSRYVIIGVVVAVLFFITFQLELVVFVLESGIIDLHYLAYLDDSEARFSKSGFVLRVLIAAFLFVNIKENMAEEDEMMKSRERLMVFFFLISIVDFFLLTTGLLNNWLSRLAWYTNIVLCISVPYCFSVMKSRYRRIWLMAFIGVFLFNWYYLYIVQEGGATYPYRSEILDIGQHGE